MRRAALLLLALLTLAGCGGSDKTGAPQPAPASGVRELANILELRSDFEADAGKTRVILLLSPTWGTCIAGARWARENILEKEQSQDLQIYAVWLNQRSTDAREEIDESILADPRVTQYWDEEGVTGTYFAETDLGGLGYSGFVYDVYYVFGGDAAWADEPAPLAGSGSPVLYKGEEPLDALDAQL